MITTSSNLKSGLKLNGWKETAAYLGFSVRTVQRWEALGLPLHRPLRRHNGAVIAFAWELDAWVMDAPACRTEILSRLRAQIDCLEGENACLKQLLLHATHSSGNEAIAPDDAVSPGELPPKAAVVSITQQRLSRAAGAA